MENSDKGPKGSASVPAYQRAIALIRRMAESSDYSAGDKIPSERVLAKDMGLSRMTVRRAVDELVRAGVLERRSTSGTMVASAKVIRPLDPDKVLGIPQIIRSSGGKPSSELLFFGTVEASESLAAHLEVAAGDPVVLIRMLQKSDGVPFCVERSYLPAARVPGLSEADLVQGRSLYILLRERYGIEPTHTRGVLTAAQASPEDAAPILLSQDSTVLIYRVTVYDQSGAPIERAISINHPRRTLFSTERRLVTGAAEDVMRSAAPPQD